MKGIKNILADTMSRLFQLDPAIIQELEPEGYKFAKHLSKKNPADTDMEMNQYPPVLG